MFSYSLWVKVVSFVKYKCEGLIVLVVRKQHRNRLQGLGRGAVHHAEDENSSHLRNLTKASKGSQEDPSTIYGSLLREAENFHEEKSNLIN